MAARLNPRNQASVRLKIKGSQLVNALQDHVLADKKMSPSAVVAALGLLKKIVPDLSSSSVTVTHRKRISYAQRLAQEAATSTDAPAEAVGNTVQ